MGLEALAVREAGIRNPSAGRIIFLPLSELAMPRNLLFLLIGDLVEELDGPIVRSPVGSMAWMLRYSVDPCLKTSTAPIFLQFVYADNTILHLA
jgi:hypothetical protein